MMTARRIVIFATTFTAAGAACSPAAAQVPPSYGLDFVTVGAPGNAAYAGGPTGQMAGRGSVGYEYRIMRTEITNQNWIEFCNAYGPHYNGSPTSVFLTGGGVGAYYNTGGQVVYWTSPSLGQAPASPTWRMAARYANWLTNGKVNEAWAFESGAYDASTFTPNPQGGFNDQRVHTPGATFWLPSLDEWIKATYYDPNRYGPASGGWWTYPDQSDDPLVIGLPGEGGETNASLGWMNEKGPLQVGLYPWSASPWGMLDASGGLREMAEGLYWPLMGSSLDSVDILVPIEDRIGYSVIYSPEEFSNGFRLVSVVPNGPVWPIVMALAVALRWWSR